MRLKEIYWTKDGQVATVNFMGVTLSVYQNNGKWDARLNNPTTRPEIETGFDTAEEAMRYAESTLLCRELNKHFYDVYRK